jgi:hypothetical protein
VPRRSLAISLAELDPGLTSLRAAAVTMTATLASFGTALLIEHMARLSTSIVVLAVALTLSLGRTGPRAGQPRGPRGWVLAAVVLPLVAVGASEIGSRFLQQPDLGDALFVLAMSATIWLRRFGAAAREIARLATFPLVAMLIVPAPIVTAWQDPARPGQDDPARLERVRADIGDLRRANARQLPPEPGAWSRLPDAVGDPSRTVDVPAPAPAPNPQGRSRGSTEWLPVPPAHLAGDRRRPTTAARSLTTDPVIAASSGDPLPDSKSNNSGAGGERIRSD